MSRIQFSILHLLLIFSLCGAGNMSLSAQDGLPTELTAGLKPALDLRGDWIDEDGKLYTVPFLVEGEQSIEIGRVFNYNLTEHPVYLYFEGLAWTAEVYVDEALMQISRQPFGEVLIPLEPRVTAGHVHKIRVVLDRKDPPPPLYPRPFLGITHGAALMVPADTLTLPLKLNYVPSKGKGIVLAPLHPQLGTLQDSAWLAEILTGSLAFPHEFPVYFPFPPSTAALQLLDSLNTPVLKHLKETDSVAFYTPYLISEEPLRENVKFWRTETGEPTDEYGTFYLLSDLRMSAPAEPDQLILILLLLVPVLGLMIMKFAAPRTYSSMPEFLTKHKIYLELIANQKFLKDGPRWWMTIFRVALVAAGLAIWLYFLENTGRLNHLNVFRPTSYVYHLLHTYNPRPELVFGVLFVGIAFLNLVKYLLLKILGGIYRVHGLAVSVQNLDIFASLPLVLVTLIPAPFIFFVPSDTARIFLLVWNILGAIYLFRRTVLIYVGLSRLFSFSTTLKILYICTLEILPWIILL